MEVTQDFLINILSGYYIDDCNNMIILFQNSSLSTCSHKYQMGKMGGHVLCEQKNRGYALGAKSANRQNRGYVPDHDFANRQRK